MGGGESGSEQMHIRVVKDRMRVAKILSNSWLKNSTAFLEYPFCFVWQFISLAVPELKSE